MNPFNSRYIAASDNLYYVEYIEHCSEYYPHK
jgi:hypothetical protein